METYDLLLKGGRVVDPSQDMDKMADVALSRGQIAEVAEVIPPHAAVEVIDVTGKLVVPGLVDIHTHVYIGVTSLIPVEADPTCLAKGATTIADAGSAGAYTIDGFRRFIAEPAKTRILAFLNISSIGMPSIMRLPELGWLRLVDVDAAVEAIEANRDLVVGLKIRMMRPAIGENGAEEPLNLALGAAKQAGVPLMIHIGDTPIPLPGILNLLRPGDIVTHTYNAVGGYQLVNGGKSWRKLPPVTRGAGTTILDSNGRVIPEAWEAKERGVIMDVGYGVNSFCFEVFSTAFDQGFTPDIISSDLHQLNLHGPVYDFPTVMSCFLCLGMTLQQVIEASTTRPAQVLGLADEIGTLRPGASGDVAVMDLLEGRFEYRDATGASIRGASRLLPHLTVRAGKLAKNIPLGQNPGVEE